MKSKPRSKLRVNLITVGFVILGALALPLIVLEGLLSRSADKPADA